MSNLNTYKIDIIENHSIRTVEVENTSPIHDADIVVSEELLSNDYMYGKTMTILSPKTRVVTYNGMVYIVTKVS